MRSSWLAACKPFETPYAYGMGSKELASYASRAGYRGWWWTSALPSFAALQAISTAEKLSASARLRKAALAVSATRGFAAASASASGSGSAASSASSRSSSTTDASTTGATAALAAAMDTPPAMLASIPPVACLQAVLTAVVDDCLEHWGYAAAAALRENGGGGGGGGMEAPLMPLPAETPWVSPLLSAQYARKHEMMGSIALDGMGIQEQGQETEVRAW